MYLFAKTTYLQANLNQEDFIALVTQHKAMLYKVCNMYCSTEHDKQDLFQEIVIQLWGAYPRFRGDSKFSTWLYRIALNTAISDLRKQKKHIRTMEPEKLPTEIQDIQYSKDKEEKIQQLYRAIRHLTEIERAIVMLYLEDRSYDEMEDILGINQNNLRVKMNRIKEKLRKLTKSVEHGVG